MGLIKQSDLRVAMAKAVEADVVDARKETAGVGIAVLFTSHEIILALQSSHGWSSSL